MVAVLPIALLRPRHVSQSQHLPVHRRVSGRITTTADDEREDPWRKLDLSGKQKHIFDLDSFRFGIGCSQASVSGPPVHTPQRQAQLRCDEQRGTYLLNGLPRAAEREPAGRPPMPSFQVSRGEMCWQ
jgi:hypothetical protein